MSSSYFEYINLSLKNNKVKTDEVFSINLNFSLNGKIKKVFNPKIWKEAYEKGERKFFITYYIKLKCKRKFFSKDLMPKDKIRRKAIIFWTRNPILNPNLEKMIWITLVLEDKMPYVPSSVEEIHKKLFNLNKRYEIRSNYLGKGIHKIYAEIIAKWSNYTFISKGKVIGKSNLVKVECV